eukprot:gnl/Dysnectes_brevis/4412_a5913_561.p1 GENE.gnl/Dysnectes_brevis/4412_a5913_561~~gnl/Dysnectes_brevis/4412_a5913_561.p1  ORF type:complete len:295 (-),score=-1.41 gnl/Dysnectes_brevis/4412_a5913_561:436-1320(-)
MTLEHWVLSSGFHTALFITTPRLFVYFVSLCVILFSKRRGLDGVQFRDPKTHSLIIIYFIFSILPPVFQFINFSFGFNDSDYFNVKYPKLGPYIYELLNFTLPLTMSHLISAGVVCLFLSEYIVTLKNPREIHSHRKRIRIFISIFISCASVVSLFVGVATNDEGVPYKILRSLDLFFHFISIGQAIVFTNQIKQFSGEALNNSTSLPTNTSGFKQRMRQRLRRAWFIMVMRSVSFLMIWYWNTQVLQENFKILAIFTVYAAVVASFDSAPFLPCNCGNSGPARTPHSGPGRHW